MSKREILLKGNRVVGLFMGYTFKEVDSSFIEGSGVWVDKEGGFFCDEFDLRYDLSWDMLVPVIKKILGIDGIDMSSWRMITNPMAYDREKVFNQVVEFIEWYNLNKK